jgi:hypothetical protein
MKKIQANNGNEDCTEWVGRSPRPQAAMERAPCVKAHILVPQALMNPPQQEILQQQWTTWRV